MQKSPDLKIFLLFSGETERFINKENNITKKKNIIPKKIIRKSTMGILFKIYNKKYQLHFYNEDWSLQTKHQLDEILALFEPQEAAKIKITPVDNKIELQLHGMFVDCKNKQDLLQKFALLVEMKEKYQKMIQKGQKGRKTKKE